MKAVIPVAGYGTRLRPHTHTLPKSLLYVAGKPILGHILDQVTGLGIRDVILVTGFMGYKVKEFVESAYPNLSFSYASQDAMLGPGHAVSLAEPFISRDDKLLIIYGDTIFVGDMKQGLKTAGDAALAVKRVNDPRRFGVVEMKDDGVINVVEKPDYVKPMDAMIGIYFINNTGLFVDAMHEMIKTERKTKGEFYLTDAFKIMIEKGAYITTFRMEGWYDCGKPETLLATNRHLLDRVGNGHEIKGNNAVIIPPVHIGKNAEVSNSIIGPYVSIADNARVETSIIRDSIINRNAIIINAQLKESLIGENAVVRDIMEKLNVGDNSEISFSGE